MRKSESPKAGWLPQKHRTEIALDNVLIFDITKMQVHGHFAIVIGGTGGSNIDFSGTDHGCSGKKWKGRRGV